MYKSLYSNYNKELTRVKRNKGHEMGINYRQITCFAHTFNYKISHNMIPEENYECIEWSDIREFTVE